MQQKKPIFETKLVRFGYRYKYSDGEYSSFSPWSELAFLPDVFDYKVSKAYNLGMLNTVRELVIKDFIPYKIPLDVVSVDILYKTTDSPNVYVVETIEKEKNPEWELFTPNGLNSNEIKTGQISITSEMIHRALPSSQTLRSWDNVPRHALAQEIVGNRLVYANYTQGYNIDGPINLTQNITSQTIYGLNISNNLDTLTPHRSIKSLRDYKVGMVFGDKYGRETPVISSGYTMSIDSNEHESSTGDISVEKTLSIMQNSLVVSQNWENLGGPNDWIDYVKYYVKETSNEYYNLIMDRWYDSGDETVWLSFNSADRNKVDEETYLILKNKNGSEQAVLEKARYKVIAIENEAPDYIKTYQSILGEIGQVNAISDAAPGVGGLDETNTLDIWSVGVEANTGIPAGLMSGLSCKIDVPTWDTVFNSSSEQGVFGREMKGFVEFRVIGRSWDGSSYQYEKATSWRKLTGYRKTDGDSYVQITWDKKFFGEVDFFNFWNDDSDVENNGTDTINQLELVYSFEFKESVVENKPEFDGKFFVKIEKDLALQSAVMTYGSTYDWTTDAIYNLSYISSTVTNESSFGLYSSDSAVFDQPSTTGHFFSEFGPPGIGQVFSAGSWQPTSTAENYFEFATLDFTTNGPFGSIIEEYMNYGYAIDFANETWATNLSGTSYNQVYNTTIDPTTVFEDGSTGEEANYGVFGSGTWHHNAMTRNFWQTYATSEHTGHDGSPTKNNAFIDGAKARQLYFNSDNEVNSEGGGFYTPESLSQGNTQVGMGQITISRLADYLDAAGQSTQSPGAIGLMQDLQIPGTHFSFENRPEIYRVESVVTQSQNGKNFSDNGVPAYYESFILNDYVNGGQPVLNELCTPCGEYQNFASDFYTTQSSNPNSWDPFTRACERISIKVNFVLVDQFNGNVTGTATGLDIGEGGYDPRSRMHHDGRDSISISIRKPVSIVLGDDSPDNTLGACWETEPKENADLDIYYEASDAIPMVLTENNAYNFAPINSSVSVKRVDTGTDSLVDLQFWNGKINHKVRNLYFTNDLTKEVIVEVVSNSNGGPNVQYDANGDGSLQSNLILNTNEVPTLHVGYVPNSGNPVPDIVVGDTIVFTHKNGLKTSSVVTGYYNPIDDSVNGAFDNITTADETTGLTTGPKAFQKIAGNTPTGYYSISTDVWDQPVQLAWYNCYAFGNGVESDRIRDDFNAPQIDNGVKVSTTFSGYKKETIGSGLIYSGLYNSTSQVNELNEFNMSQKITKELNPSYGSIQALKTRDTDIVVLAQDKILKVLSNKDAVFNADGNPQLTATNKVLGTAIPFVGDYGISNNPESLASDQYRLYFTDKQRGAVLRLSRDGLTPISNVGMRSWFRKNLRKSVSAIGTFDTVSGEYNLTINKDFEGGEDYSTLSFNEASKGWVSFKTFAPDSGISLSGKYITTKDNSIYEHHVNVSSTGTIVDRNTFYNLGYTSSKILISFNDSPDLVKSFKSISYNGSQSRVRTQGYSYQGMFVDIANYYTGAINFGTDDNGNEVAISASTSPLWVDDNEYYNLVEKQGWFSPFMYTDLEKGRALQFKEKEGMWFSEIQGVSDGLGVSEIDTSDFSVQGVGTLYSSTYTQDDVDGSICNPPCPSDEECVAGICTEIDAVIYGCMDEEAVNYQGPGNLNNYSPAANTDDGSCQYATVTGCMDPMSPGYDPYAIVQSSNNDCPTYVYGCMDYDTPAINVLTNATNGVDGQCYLNGELVDCAWESVLNSSGLPINTALFDTFIPVEYYSCLYETDCPDGQYSDVNGNCSPQVEGCTNSFFCNFNPSATIDDGTCSNQFDLNGDPCGEIIYGCTDSTACNYNPDATQTFAGWVVGFGYTNCEFVSCAGCKNLDAENYCDWCTVEDESMCLYDVGYTQVGCMDTAASNYQISPNGEPYDPPANIPCDGCCQYDVPCEDTNTCVPDGDDDYVDTTVCCPDSNATNYNNSPEDCSSWNLGVCSYTLNYCLDAEAPNSPLYGMTSQEQDNWMNLWNNTYTINNDLSLCDECVYGCTDEFINGILMFNYDANATCPGVDVVDQNQGFYGPCIPTIPGCMDSTMSNYDFYANVDGDLCVPFIYGCTDPEAINYNPDATNEFVMELETTTITVMDPGEGLVEIGLTTNIEWVSTDVYADCSQATINNIDTGVANTITGNCQCEYEDTNSGYDNIIKIRNYQGDSDAIEENA